MNSLITGLVAEVLDRLHHEAEIADGPLFADALAAGASYERLIADTIAAERADLQGLYRAHAGHFLSVSRALGRSLYMLARARQARRIVEFGTSMGVSTIYLAAALRDLGGGHLIGTELEPGKAERARRNLEAAGLADLVELRVGDARETLARIEGAIDMVVLDGAFTLYLPVLKLLEPHLSRGALIFGENAFAQAGGYLDYVRDPSNGYLSQSVPFDGERGNELTIATR